MFTTAFARRLVSILLASFLAGCGAQYSPVTTAPFPNGSSTHALAVTTATPTPCTHGCLYVTNAYDDATCLCTKYNWDFFTPPFNGSSKAQFGKSLNFANNVAADSAYLATTGSDVAKAKVYHLPFTGGPYFAAIPLGGHPVSAAFDRSRDLWVANDNNQIEEFVPPFSSTMHHTRVVTQGIATPLSIAFDASNNLYVGQAPNGFASGPVDLLRFPPPYTAAPVRFDPGTFPFGIAIHGTTLAVTGEAAVGIRNCNCGNINVFTLPLNSSSTPVTMNFSNYGVPGAPAFDAAGNLFVPLPEPLHSAPGGVIVYRPPFTSSNLGAYEIHQGLGHPGAAAIGP